MNKSSRSGPSSDDENPGIMSSWLHALLQPALLFHGGEQFFVSAFITRPWRRILLFSPVLLVLTVGVGLILYGQFISRDALITRYAQLAETELAQLKKTNAVPEEQSTRNSVLMQEEQTSAYSDMLFRRLLRLNDENARTRYLVAIQLVKSQRLSQARRLMDEIAPANGKGYPPAHAWLAVDLLSQQPLNKEQQTILLNHLDMVKDWEGAGSGLLAVYANVLAAQGKRLEALDVMGKAARKDPGLQSAYSIMARKLNVPRIAEDVSKRAREDLQASIKSSDATPQHFIRLASLELTEENFEAVLDVAHGGLNSVAKDNEQLRFLASEALRLMYRKSIRKSDKGVEFNLNLLDAAMKEFPSNPNLSTEIVLLEDMGVQASAELRSLMETQLAEGKATALAHLILANQKIKAGKLHEAIPHLELTLKTAPGYPVALNNLAMALAMTDATKIDRAKELINQAIAADPRNPELYDSQGQILLVANKPLDAIPSFEKAIGIDPNRIGSREAIVKAYRLAGMDALAEAQEKTTAQLKAKMAAKPVTTSEPADAPVDSAPVESGKSQASEPSTPNAPDQNANEVGVK